MKALKWFVLVVVLAALVCPALLLRAGSLNPPSPPEPTMKTLDEIFSAAASQDPPVGAADARWIVAMEIEEYPGSWNYPYYEDHSKVVDMEYSFSKPYDPVTGSVTGDRALDAVCVTKNIDKASVGLAHAFDIGQRLSNVYLKFLWYDPEGGIEEYYRIRLIGVRVVGFSQREVHRGGDEYAHLEVINFIWEEMEWNWIPDSVIETIEWGPPAH